MNKNIQNLFDELWNDYIKLTPTAKKIHKLLGSDTQADIQNDHIALRTFDVDRVKLEKLALPFQMLGYKETATYHFEEKKLVAKHYEHPEHDAPKVFISQLLTKEFSPTLQKIVNDITMKVKDGAIYKKEFLTSGIHWAIDSATYETLLSESEYAAWLYVWGFRANHFTVSVNALENYDSLEAVNKALLEAGFRLNDVGGLIKGSKELMLEQSATLADEVLVEFKDKNQMIPSCFYEFARRYENSEGELFSGFVEASANAIFESTHKR